MTWPMYPAGVEVLPIGGPNRQNIFLFFLIHLARFTRHTTIQLLSLLPFLISSADQHGVHLRRLCTRYMY